MGHLVFWPALTGASAWLPQACSRINTYRPCLRSHNNTSNHSSQSLSARNLQAQCKLICVPSTASSMQSSSNSIGSGKPFRFALKELVMPKVFPVGLEHDVRDYVPLSEAALQRYMRHPSIVDTYWADVRCLHPKTHAQLPVEVWDIADTDFDAYDDAPRGGGGVCCKKKAVPTKLTCVRLQLRIAMEHCDLGALPSSSASCAF